MPELRLENSIVDDRYFVDRCLGRGSYAEIFLAYDQQRDNEPIIIKALNFRLQGTIDRELELTLVENFQNEAVALDKVRHPHIIRRLGHGTAADLQAVPFHYLVLEYMPGGDFNQLCKNQGCGFTRALDYLEQVCAGLSFAHSQDIIHRDIKPQNLLLTGDRKTVKICDFGVARLAATDDPITRVGTNIYAPPEHSPMLADSAVFVNRQLTPSADIYSLAKSAYAMITGESPRRFVGSSVTDLPEKYASEPWAEGLLQVLRKATQFAPSLRHQSVTEFWQDLVRVKIAAESSMAVKSLEQVPIPEDDLVPQSQISTGYMPNAPERPKFNTSRELKLSTALDQELPNPKIVVKIDHASPGPAVPLASPAAKNGSLNRNYRPVYKEEKAAGPNRSGLFATPGRGLVTVAVLLLVFAGILYGTQAYMRSRGFSLPSLTRIFTGYSEGVASSDINLRPEASARRDPVGLVPKDSRLRIVNSTDNWYEVDVIEYGRPKQNPDDLDHGWVNKQYVDLR